MLSAPLQVWWSVVAALCLVPAAMAQPASQSIFKCVEAETTTYQSMPCGVGKTEVRVLTIAPANGIATDPQLVAIPKASGPVPAAQSRGKIWPPRRTLMLGMSDDEVLNLPGWGVPQRIARSKASRGWQEEWIYAAPSGERRLTFVNATLVDALIDAETAQQLARDRSAGYPAT